MQGGVQTAPSMQHAHHLREAAAQTVAVSPLTNTRMTEAAQTVAASSLAAALTEAAAQTVAANSFFATLRPVVPVAAVELLIPSVQWRQGRVPAQSFSFVVVHMRVCHR